MFQQVAMKERQSPDDRVGKIHNQIYGASRADIDGVEPLGPLRPVSIFPVDEKMHLVNVKRMNLMGIVDHAPANIIAGLHSQHWAICWLVLLVVDIEAVSIFRKLDRELRITGFQGV